jgi:glycosyltransferase involved in cell wall biosynthesis
MRILYHHRTRATDAQGIHIFQIVKALRDAGHTVELASVARADGPLQESSAGGGPKSTGLQKVPYLSELVQLGYNAMGIPMLLWKMRRGRVDFVYERYSLFNFSGVLAAKLMGRPIVLEVNSPLALEQYRDGHIRWYGLAKWAERVVCNLATKVLVVSTPLARIMKDEGVAASKLEVMPNGVDLGQFEHHLATQRETQSLRESLRLQGSVLIGFAGWFKAWHGLELLLDAFRKKDLASKGAKLVLIGDGPAMPALQEYVRNHGLGESVVFTGPVAHDEMPRYLALVDIAVQPAANEYCCPMKILEYMALGKAIVAPRQDNILDLLDDTSARFFTPRDEESLGNALEELIRDSALRTRLGSAARSAIDCRGLRWERNTERVISMVGGMQGGPVEHLSNCG